MKIKYVSVLAVAASLFAVAVQAQQVVSHYAEIPNVTLGAPQVLELPKFDSALGELTGVTLNFTGEIWQSIYGENMSASAAAYDFSSTAQLSVSKGDGFALFRSPAFSLKRQGTAGAYDGTVNFDDALGVHFDQNVATSGMFIDPVLSDYIGVGKIDFKTTLTNATVLNSGINFAKGSSLASAAGLSVDYTFVPLAAIPEPSTCAALMGVMVALAAAGLKRRRVLAV